MTRKTSELLRLTEENRQLKEKLILLDESFDSECNCDLCWIMRSKGKEKSPVVIERNNLKEKLEKIQKRFDYLKSLQSEDMSAEHYEEYIVLKKILGDNA